MASDYLLEIDGIKGESQDDKHRGEIEILSFSWGVSNSAAFTGGGGSAGKVSVQDFSFTTRVSRASPPLALACATGQHIKKATLTVRKAGQKPLEYMKVVLQDVLISSYQQGAGPSGTPTDQFSINYSKIEFSYRPTLPGGGLGLPVVAVIDNPEGPGPG